MATVDPQDQAKINKLYQEYIDLLQKVEDLSFADAKIKADAARSTGTLTKETERLNRQLQDTVFYADSIAQGFKETLAELKGQNVQLNIGKSAFKALSNIASDLNYFQKGISDQTEKQFKIQQEKVLKGKEELIDVRNRLGVIGNENKYRNQSIIDSLKGQDSLTQSQKNLLKELEKEKALLEAANDAIKEGIPTLQRELDISKQIYDVRENLGGLASAAAGVVSKYGGDLSKFLKVDDAIDSVKKYNQSLIDGALKSKKTIEEIQKIEKDRIDTIQNSASVQRSINNEILNIEKQINEVRKESAKETARRAELIRVEARLASGQITDQDEINRLTSKQKDLKKEIKDFDDKRANKIAPLENDRLKQQNELLNTQIKEKQDLAAFDEKEANEKIKAIESVNTLTNKFKSLGVLFKSLGAGFIKGLTDPLAILTFIIDKALTANAQVVELGKSLGLSAGAAENLRQDYADFARSTGDTFINTDRLLKAQSELSKELGIAVRFSNEELATFAKLTELTGLSAQEAGKLAQASAAAGIPTEKYADSIREAAFYAQQATGTHFSSKEILQDVSKLSAGILVKFQGNPKAIGQAVVEAKKLGLTLEQIDKVGESLLNFEQSIENELKAELLTGKQLNLERARAAALSGDQLALTKEISSQVGTLEDFQNMNVIAQKSLADAFGLSRDEMSEMLIKQEAINKYGDEAAKLNKEQLEDMKRQGLSASEYLKKQEQQRTAQAKFQDAIVKLQDLIGNLVAGPVGQLLDALADIVSVAVNILSIFNPLFKVISFIAEKISDFASTDFGKVVLSMGAITLFLPKIATGLGLATKGVMGLGTGIASVFKADTWKSWGKGLQSVFNKDKFTGFFSSLKDKFLEAAGLNKKLEEGLTDTITGAAADKTKEVAAGATEKIVEAGEESLTDKLKDKATETIEGKVEDKAGDLQDKIMGGAEETEDKTDKVERGSDGSKFKDKMTNIAEGIKAFGNGKVILGGLVGLPASAVGLIAMIPGVAGAKLIELINGPKFAESMIGLSTGISLMGTLTVTGGAANLIAASTGLIAMIPGVAGAKLIELINGPKFTESMIGLSTGISAMGTPSVFLGSLGLIAASAGLIAMIPGVIGGSLLGVAGPLIQAGLTSLSVGLTTFGTVAANPMVWAGIGLLASFGAALIPLGYALKLMSPAIESFGKAIKSAFEGIGAIIIAAATGIATMFNSLQNVDVTKLLAIGPALIGIGVGLASLGAGGIIGAIGAFLGGDPIEKLQDLAAAGDGLTKTATALQSIAGALIGVSVALAAIDISKLAALDEFASNRSTESIVGGITDFITAPIKAVGEAIGVGGKEEINAGIDLTPMIAAINEVTAAVNKLHNKDTAINMDGKKVGTTLVQNSYKVA
jgi:hypothetical protein